MTGPYNKRSEYDDEPRREVPMVPVAIKPLDPVISQIKNVNKGKLPAIYSDLKAALAQVQSIDEAREWENKFEAAKGWAHFYQEKDLEKMFKRAKLWARRRAGECKAAWDKELENDFTAGAAEKSKKEKKRGRPSSTGRSAAKAAGMSDRGLSSAAALAAIPEEEFKQMVDAEPPASVAELEIAGRKPPQKAEGVPERKTDGAYRGEPIRKSDYKEANALMAFLKDAAKIVRLEPAKAFAVMTSKERDKVCKGFAELADYCSMVVKTGRAL